MHKVSRSVKYFSSIGGVVKDFETRKNSETQGRIWDFRTYDFTHLGLIASEVIYSRYLSKLGADVESGRGRKRCW